MLDADSQLSEPTMLVIRVGSSVVQFIGILVSIFRLWSRLQTQRLWWEDLWALTACICAIVLLVSEWIYLKGSWAASVVGFWIYALVLTFVIWAVRMSILFSVARIAHPTDRMRRIVTALAAFFSLISLTFVAMKVWWYARDSKWTKEATFYSRPAPWLPFPMYVYELCTDCIVDAILIYLPVRVLYGMNLPTKQRTMIVAIFSSSIIVTIMSIFRGISQMLRLRSLVGIATDFQAAFSTVTCNLLVVAMLVYRLSRRASSSDVSGSDAEPEECDSATSNGPTMTTLALTTVDLNTLDYWDSTQRSNPVNDRPWPC